ncbi:MAG: glycoside hydrolase [Ruminococcus sp.]|nr:glycoside hydrolase [Ruminococcus sp.]
MAEIKCIDVSEWQGSIDFEKVKASGIEYAILRAGFGREASQVDAEFESNYKKAKASGVKLGAYWYSYAVDVADAKKEAKACISVLKGKSFELPIFYDMEDNSQTKLGKATLTNMAKAFMTELLKAGYRVGIYANANWFENYLDYKSLYGTYYVWLAQYNSEAEFKCDVWQYTSSGKVQGVSGNVDMNIIYSDKMIKSTSDTSEEDKTPQSFEVAALQSLLILSERLGIITQTITPIDNKKGKMTSSAILQMKKSLKMAENQTVDLVFIRKMHQAIVDALSKVGDINGDGKVNVKDVTALQKRIAGVEDV